MPDGVDFTLSRNLQSTQSALAGHNARLQYCVIRTPSTLSMCSNPARANGFNLHPTSDQNAEMHHPLTPYSIVQYSKTSICTVHRLHPTYRNQYQNTDVQNHQSNHIHISLHTHSALRSQVCVSLCEV